MLKKDVYELLVALKKQIGDDYRSDVKSFNKGVDIMEEAVCNTLILNKIIYKPESQEEICIGTQYFTSEFGDRQFSALYVGYGPSEKEALADLVEKLI